METGTAEACARLKEFWLAMQAWERRCQAELAPIVHGPGDEKWAALDTARELLRPIYAEFCPSHDSSQRSCMAVPEDHPDWENVTITRTLTKGDEAWIYIECNVPGYDFLSPRRSLYVLAPRDGQWHVIRKAIRSGRAYVDVSP
jgi:hypothetical protein